MGRMKTTTLLSALAAAAAALLLAPGCADNLSGSSYSSSTSRSGYVEQEGELLAVTPVTIEGKEGSVGLLAGSILGAAVGSTIGGGHGRTVATALGGVAGGAVGAGAEKSVTKQNGVELRVKLDDGRVVNVTQTLGDDYFVPGQRVRVLFGADTRVRPL